MRTPLASTGQNLGSLAQLIGTGASAITMSLDASSNTYTAAGLPMEAFVSGVNYTLGFPEEGISHAGAVQTPSGFDAIEPLGMLNDATMAFSQPISAEAAAFTWAPAGVSDGLVISIMVYDGVTYALRGEVLCWAADTGGFVVDPTVFYSPTAFAGNDLLFIGIHRYTGNSDDQSGGRRRPPGCGQEGIHRDGHVGAMTERWGMPSTVDSRRVWT